MSRHQLVRVNYWVDQHDCEDCNGSWIFRVPAGWNAAIFRTRMQEAAIACMQKQCGSPPSYSWNWGDLIDNGCLPKGVKYISGEPVDIELTVQHDEHLADPDDACFRTCSRCGEPARIQSAGKPRRSDVPFYGDHDACRAEANREHDRHNQRLSRFRRKSASER